MMAAPNMRTAAGWRAAGDILGRAALAPGRTSEVTRSRAGQKVDLRPEAREWRHPWSMRPQWNGLTERWEAVVVKPGFVNGWPATVPGMEDADGETATLCDFPAVPLRGLRRGLSQESGEVTAFFTARGVRETAEEPGITAMGTLAATVETLDTNPLPPRQLAACDFYLATARPTFQPSITQVDPLGVSGLTVDYAVIYDFAMVDLHGVRSRWQQAPRFVPNRRPTFAERLLGIVGDEGEDRINIATVFLLSPPDAPEESEPDAEWSAWVQYHCFWNLRYEVRNTAPRQAPPPLRLFTGLAFGLGDAIGNQMLSGVNELSTQVFNAAATTSPEGHYVTT